MPTTDPRQELRSTLGPLLGILSQLYQSRLAEMLAPHELTYTQFSLLHHLHRADEPQTVTHIAQALEVNQPAVSKVVQKLAQRDLVTTSASAGDSRRKLVDISSTGRRRVDEVGREIDVDFAEWFADWTVEEMGQFTGQVWHLIQRLDAERFGDSGLSSDAS